MTNGVVAAVGVVIFAQLLAQPRGLDPNRGSVTGIERSRPVEDLNGDGVALQPFAASGQSFIDDVFQEPLTPSRLGERAAVEDAAEFHANGILVGFAPALERNCRHGPTPEKRRESANPAKIGVGFIPLHTTTGSEALSRFSAGGREPFRFGSPGANQPKETRKC